jgi:hypothetical protein
VNVDPNHCFNTNPRCSVASQIENFDLHIRHKLFTNSKITEQDPNIKHYANPLTVNVESQCQYNTVLYTVLWTVYYDIRSVACSVHLLELTETLRLEEYVAISRPGMLQLLQYNSEILEF